MTQLYKFKDLERLEEFGFQKSKVLIHPEGWHKIVDLANKYILIVNTSPKNINMWSGKDANKKGIMRLWKCSRLDLNHVWGDGEIAPYYEKNTTPIPIDKYIRDLMGENVVESVGAVGK